MDVAEAKRTSTYDSPFWVVYVTGIGLDIISVVTYDAVSHCLKIV